MDENVALSWMWLPAAATGAKWAGPGSSKHREVVIIDHTKYKYRYRIQHGKEVLCRSGA